MLLLPGIPSLALLSLLPIQGKVKARHASLHPVGTAIIRINAPKSPEDEKRKRLSFFLVYPAQKRGKHTPLSKQEGPFPALVFLHGLGGTGKSPEGLARFLAARGFLVFLLDGSRFDPERQKREAKATYEALLSENTRKGSLLYHRLDPKRIALGGHSMGGGTTLRVLAENPGFCAGVLVAPWNGMNFRSPKDPSPKVKEPCLVITGDEDRILNWKKNALRIFQHMNNPRGSSLFVLLEEVGHRSVIYQKRFSLFGTRSKGPAQTSTFPVIAAFLEKTLCNNQRHISEVLKTIPHLKMVQEK